jgi:hypothetical protein
MTSALGYDGKWTLQMKKLSLLPSDVVILDPIREGRQSSFLS